VTPVAEAPTEPAEPLRGGVAVARPRLAILGCRGIPAGHGGFETFAERFALYLVDRGWDVRVYCQTQGQGPPLVSRWRGVELVTVAVRDPGSWGTIVFDWLSLRHACAERFPLLTLGYNTAVFAVVSRLARCRNVMNMDGIEWKRQKWSLPVRGWFFVNEKLGCWLANDLVADHPGIAEHLVGWAPRAKITVIPYGADRVETADPRRLDAFGVTPDRYLLIVGRPEPENSILEMVQAFSSVAGTRKLVVLGDYRPERSAYHRAVLRAAGPATVLPGAIYDEPTVQALRVHARVYLHGHQVGGTNPSLVEALGCASAIVAHDNPFNRWVAGSAAYYFGGRDACEQALARLLDDDAEIARMRRASLARHHEAFEWAGVLARYEQLCRGSA
jgi:glycosyltransferase involved in cell wall biosynthesis